MTAQQLVNHLAEDLADSVRWDWEDWDLEHWAAARDPALMLRLSLVAHGSAEGRAAGLRRACLDFDLRVPAQIQPRRDQLALFPETR